ncbi:MAG: EthD family reductase [Gammaproteobacteria bacterium]|nr:EthD family reductase [Gammaproteobacteria bacterium]
MIRASALYFAREGARFDFEYYRDTHFPMVMDRLAPFGARRHEIERGLAMGDGSAPRLLAIGSIYFESLEGLKAGLAAHGAEILGDVSNYTNLQPELQFSELVAP